MTSLVVRHRALPAFIKPVPLPIALFLVAAALRLVAFAVFYVGSLATGHHGLIDPYDSVSIDRLAWYTAQHFRSGQWVDLRVISLAGSWDVGFTYLVAFEYTIVGHHPEVPRAIDCLLAAFSAPAVYLAARHTSVGEVIARRAGWLVAVWPLSLYWSGYDILKDPLVWFFLAVALLAIGTARWLNRAVVGAISAGGVYLVRTYMGPIVAVIMVVTALFRRDWKGLLVTLGLLVVIEVALIGMGFPPVVSLDSYTTKGAVAATGGEAAIASTANLNSPIVVAKRLLVGIPIESLGPRFALKDISRPTLDSGMYPGLLVWIVLIPFTVLGFWRAARRRDPVLNSIGLFAIAIWGTLAILYVGEAWRQREMAFPATLLFTSLGLERPMPRYWWWFYAAIGLVGVLALLGREAGFLPRIAY